jgi:hypothetical protein
MVNDTTQAKQEGLSQLEFRFQTDRFCKNDPKGLVLKHGSQVSSYLPYAHKKFEDEVFRENAQDWDEVVARMANPKITRFKSMILDEQVTILEQSAQGALRAKEEMIAVEVAEAPLVAPLQDRGFPMIQDTQERGLLMIEQAQQIIDQLQDDPDLIAMTRTFPADNPDEIQIGPSGPKLIDINEITRLDNPKITMPQDGSLVGVSAQPKIVGVSVGTSAPDSLCELIKIYDDYEILEVSLVSPVHIKEEKEPEKTSSLVPDAQIHGLPQNGK